jgi:hypothetical protein
MFGKIIYDSRRDYLKPRKYRRADILALEDNLFPSRLGILALECCR